MDRRPRCHGCAGRTPGLVVRHAGGRGDGRRALPAGGGQRRVRRRRRRARRSPRAARRPARRAARLAGQRRLDEPRTRRPDGRVRGARASGTPWRPSRRSRCAALLAADPGTRVDVLADRAGVSARQLRRRFDRAVGYGPAFLSRVARLQRFAKGAVRAPRSGSPSSPRRRATSTSPTSPRTPGRSPSARRAAAPRCARWRLAGVDVGADDRSVQDATGPRRARWAA